MSHHSRNRYLGEQVGKGRRLDDVLKEMVMVAEGVATARSVRELEKKYDIDLPIMTEVHQVLFENKDPQEATFDLLTRDSRGE
jgi:glycerol-3-phosphate dehydrogenase (NAD(P)+)